MGALDIFLDDIDNQNFYNSLSKTARYVFRNDAYSISLNYYYHVQDKRDFAYLLSNIYHDPVYRHYIKRYILLLIICSKNN